MKYSVLLVEDELNIRERILALLQEHQDVEVSGVGKNGMELQQLLTEKEFDIALLDIDLPVQNAIDVISEFASLPVIIFITAYEIYAVRAFELGAVHYLLKPVREPLFHEALERAKDYVAKNRQEKKKGVKRNIIWIREDESYITVPVRDILYLKADDKYTNIVTRLKTYRMYKPQSSFEKILDPVNFIRVHRKFIVNKLMVATVDPMFNGRYEIKLAGIEMRIPVSKKYSHKLIEKF